MGQIAKKSFQHEFLSGMLEAPQSKTAIEIKTRGSAF
jgi:hypothetical protein